MSGAILRVTISGRVQGVGYRAWVEFQARDATSKAGCATEGMAASKRCLRDPRTSWPIWPLVPARTAIGASRAVVEEAAGPMRSACGSRARGFLCCRRSEDQGMGDEEDGEV